MIYDVSLEDVSAHIPLHRLLAMILQRFLIKCYGGSAFMNPTSGGLPPTTSEDFFSNTLKGCSPSGFSSFIMEHPLRIHVFCAQVRADMWKRNGDEATDYYEWYRSVSWFENCLELDLFFLQFCAALAPPDLYVERILERYGLSNYLNTKFEQPIEYESILVQEMLTLIIQLVKERRFCGLTTAEYIRRELIYKLSAEDATYSQLVKSIPHVVSKNDDFQKILDSVAAYSEPSIVNQGMYKLRQECWKELDLYHLRFLLGDLQKAEERYFLFCKKSAVIAQLPKWTNIYPPLNGIARIATCKKTLEIVRTILLYAVFSPSRAPEGVVKTAVHLLSLALDICSQQRASGQSEVMILEFASEKIPLGAHADKSLISLLVILEKNESLAEPLHSNLSSLCGYILNKFSELDPKCSRELQNIAPEVGDLSGSSMIGSDWEKDRARGRAQQAAAMENMRAQQDKFRESHDTDVLDSESKENEVECCICHNNNTKGQMSFLIHLQKSRLLSLLNRAPLLWNYHSSPSEELAVDEDLEREFLVERRGHSFAPDLSSEDALVKEPSIVELEERMYAQCYGVDISIAGGCSQSLLLETYIASLEKVTTDCPSESSNSTRTHAYDGFGPPDCDGIHLSSCGHAVHQACLANHLASLSSRIVAEGGLIVDPAQGEFLCPKCRGLASSLLPTLPISSEKVTLPNLTALDPDISSASSSTDFRSLQIQAAASLMKNAESFVGNDKSFEAIPSQQFQRQKSNLDFLFRNICSLYFPEEDKAFDSGRVSLPLLLWDLLRYSVASTEIAARSGKQFSVSTGGSVPTDRFVPTDLLKELKSNSGFILSLLLNTIQGSKMTDIPTALLRYRGIQLLVESFCLGPSNDERNQEGNMLLLEKSNFKAQCPDIQFWKRASEPILAHDSFSSLMWTLFCLPTSFLSCREFFFSLVHMFYLVTIIQATVTCCRRRELGGLKDCLITDICNAIKDNEIPYQYFESKYNDYSEDIKDAIRCLSSPFLRRCSLLWGLANSCASFPDSHGNPVSYGSSYMVEREVDFDEVKSLEVLFKIPAIEEVLNDDMSRELARKWLHHFTVEFKPQGQNLKLYCTPSVPFSLMALPDLFEYIFHRYANERCSDCEGIIIERALCLLCGKLCDSNSEPCCSENQCQTHANACGAGTGVFLATEAASILLQRAGREAHWPSPYLDRHGEEEDTDARRGKPLTLQMGRYAFLSHVFASHSLARSSIVLREVQSL